jgi:pimeloyl-ACP methyl ester carboxylesterase
MSNVDQNAFENSWVGMIAWEDGVELLIIEVKSDGITADLPQRRLFRCPVFITQNSPTLLEWYIALSQGALTFQETPPAPRPKLICRFGSKEGHFFRDPLYPIKQENFQEWQGMYYASNNTKLVIGQNPHPESHLFFYEQNNQLVRLYPIAPNKFLSERCEAFTFWKYEGKTILFIAPSGNDPVDLEQVLPYHEERVQIPTPNGHTLGASLLLPDTPAPHPVILFCHFANTHFRDYYRLYTNHFLQQGIATLIYDKRGWGDSTGEPLFSHIQPLADDAVAVYRYLQSRPDIDPHRIGFWGASNGGWVAPLAASRVEQPACVIAVSAAGVTPVYQEQGRRVNIVRELGTSDEAIELLDRMWHLLMEFYVNGGWTHELEAIVQQVNNHAELQALPKQQDYGPGLQAVPPLIPIEELKTEGGTWADGDFDPAPVYAALKCPLLFVWGEAETVIPLEESVSRLSKALTHAHHPDFQIVRLPDTTHMMYRVPPAVEGLQPHEVETRLHGVQFAEGIREQMADWAKTRLQKE